MSFGRLIKALRIERGLTLREFCKEHGLDPSNWSKIERDINPPPRDDAIVEQWAKQMGLLEGTEQWRLFMDAAAVARKQIPADILSDKELLDKLPVFFRAIRGTEMDKGAIDAFVERIRDAHRPDHQG